MPTCKTEVHPRSERHHICRGCWRATAHPNRRKVFDEPTHPNLAPRPGLCCRCRDGVKQPVVPVMHVYDPNKDVYHGEVP